MKQYNIYPTLIDSYRLFLGTDYVSFAELIDRINRVPHKPSEAASKGMAFNSLIDSLLRGEAPPALKVQKQQKTYDASDTFEIKNDGWVFHFDKSLATSLACRLAGAMPQVFLNSAIDTPAGLVNLYGYADYILKDSVIDLKTTSSYTWPKFLNSFQHKAYMVCARDMGYQINRAEYLVTDFNSFYVEDYLWKESIRAEVVSELIGFINFIWEHKKAINNAKLFGENT